MFILSLYTTTDAIATCNSSAQIFRLNKSCSSAESLLESNYGQIMSKKRRGRYMHIVEHVDSLIIALQRLLNNHEHSINTQ